LSKKTTEFYEKKGKKLYRNFNGAEFPSLAESFLGEFDNLSVTVNALDDLIADALEQMHASENFSFKVLFTSRFDIGIERKHFRTYSIRIVLAENMRHDIERCIETEPLNGVIRGANKLREKRPITTIKAHIGLRADTQVPHTSISLRKDVNSDTDQAQNLANATLARLYLDRKERKTDQIHGLKSTGWSRLYIRNASLFCRCALPHMYPRYEAFITVSCLCNFTTVRFLVLRDYGYRA
jgi:hypothetical protein